MNCPDSVFIGVRLGKGINDFFEGPDAGQRTPDHGAASVRRLETAVLQGCLSLQSS
jgi:hypothetical protein